MIEGIRLKNFKCFRDQMVPLGGLTVLAGLNSTGKSSVIQAILCLRQWKAGAGSPWRGPLVNLGSSRNVLHDEAADDSVRIEGSFGSEGRAYFEQHPPRSRGQSGRGGCDALAGKRLEADVFYLSADRLGPRPTLPYTPGGEALPTPLGTRGEYVLSFLERTGHAPVAEDVRHPSDLKNSLAAQANAWLGSVSPGAELRIRVVPEAGVAIGTYRFSRPEDVPSAEFGAANIGFGVSYSLPLIVALLAPKRDALHSLDHLVIIENPEAHIHPGGQTSLAELAARAVASGSQVILETHSDHVLDGVRLAVRDGILPPDKVVINYFEREGLDVRVTTPQVSRTGRLDVWPQGFFDQHERNLSRLVGQSPSPDSAP